MAMFTPHAHSEATLEAARAWRDRCLVSDRSAFTDDSLWTAENFDQLRIAFVDNPQHGSDPFYTKLGRQLAPTSPNVQKLAAECL